MTVDWGEESHGSECSWTRQSLSLLDQFTRAFGSGLVNSVSDYSRRQPWWDPWNSTGKPLLLVDPNWTLIGQLPSSMHHPLGCCISTHGWPLSSARVLIGRSMGEHWRAGYYYYYY